MKKQPSHLTNLLTRSLGFALLIFCSSALNGRGATIRWVGGNGDWSAASNWNGSKVPGLTDDVVIDSLPSSQTITISSGDNQVNSIVADGSIQITGGTLRVLTLFLSSESVMLNGGTVSGGTVQTASGTALIVKSGTLDGVTVNGDVDVGNSNNGAQLTVANGLVMNGTMLLGNPTNGMFGVVNFKGNQVLGGNANVLLGAVNSYNNAMMMTDAGITVVFGPGVVIHGKTGLLGVSDYFGGAVDGKIVNQGKISADVAGGTITVNAGSFSNTGVLETKNGGVLQPSTAVDNSGRITVETGTMSFPKTFSQIAGVLDFGLNSLTDFGRITFTGTATIGGTVSAHFGTNFSAAIGKSFAILNFGKNTLSITNLNLPMSNVWQTNLNNGTLTLIVKDVLPLEASISPANQTIVVGAALTLQANVSGSGPFTYQWLRNGIIIPDATDATFKIITAQSSDSGSYTVQVNNHGGGLLSDAATVKVLAPPLIMIPPGSQIAGVGETITFNVAASGDQPISYRWIHNGQDIPGAIGSSLVLPNVLRTQAGIYTVVLSNPVGSITSAPPAVLTISGSSVCPGAPAGMVGWWRGEQNSSDYAGANDAKWNGTVAYAPGEVGDGFVLDGQASFLEIPDAKAWNFNTSDFSFELWANFNNVFASDIGGDGSSVFLGHNEGTGPRNKWFFGFGGGQLYLYVRSPNIAAKFLAQAPFNPLPHQWYHLALTRRSGVFTTFVNGIAQGSETNSIAIPDASAPLRIGESQGLLMDGMLDEVSIYQRALSLSEIENIFRSGSAGKCQDNATIQLTHGSVDVSGHFELEIGGGQMGALLIIQSSTDLKTWQNVGHVTKVHDSEIFTDNRERAGSLFYRVVSSP
jgi:hypothetical protein